MKRTAGFTLIEMLIAASIGVLILWISIFQLKSNQDGADFVYLNQLLLEDLRASGNFVSDSVSLAGYVFPSGVTLKFGASAGTPAQTYTTKNKRLSSNSWVTGTDNIIAFLFEPNTPGAACNTTVKNGCVKFRAFYTLRRGDVVLAATAAEKPEPDSRNDEASMLYYYESYLPATFGNSVSAALDQLDALNQRDKPDFSNATLSNTDSGDMFADFLAPANAGFAVDYGNAICLVDRIRVKCSTGPITKRTAVQIGFSLQGQITRGSKTDYAVPKDPLTYAAASRNAVDK